MKFTLLFILGLVSQSAFAGNGSHIIGLTGVSKGMGGTGVASAQNPSDALHKNPAALGTIVGEGSVLDFSSSLTKLNGNVSGTGPGGSFASQNGTIFNGSLAAGHRINESLVLGVGGFGYGGSNLNFSNATALSSPDEKLQLFKILPVVVYQLNDKWIVGAGPAIGIGSFKLSVAFPGGTTAKDIGFGGVAGITYLATEKLTIGLTYVSAMRHRYKSLIDLDAYTPAGPGGADGVGNDVTVTQPNEFALGFAYQASSNLLLALDYRALLWGSSTGHKEYQWATQHVIAFGAQYAINKLFLRMGYNFGTNPLKNVPSLASTVVLEGVTLAATSVVGFNSSVFNATSQHHISAGLGVAVTPTINLDAAFVWAPNITSIYPQTLATSKLNKWAAVVSGSLSF